MIKKYLPIIIALFCLGLGIGIGYKLGFQNESQVLDKKLNAIHPLRLNDASYKFINPLLAYIIPSSDQESQLASLKNNITTFINAQKKNGVDDVSVYMSQLNQGRWIGINEKDQYNPASMLKVVVMVVYLKSAEEDQNLLQTKFAYTQSESSQLDGNNFFAKSELQPGTSYTVEDLMTEMITDSDNGAEVVLLNHIDANALEALYGALNIQSPEKWAMASLFRPAPIHYFSASYTVPPI